MGCGARKMKRRKLPKHCSAFVDRHGRTRVRFRRKGFATYYFKSPAWSPSFMDELQACNDPSTDRSVIVPGATRTPAGSVSALIAAYHASPEFKSLRPSTKATYRGIIERFREEHGDKRVAKIERQHIKAIIGAKADTPAAANNLLDRLKGLMAFAVDIGMRKDNPTDHQRGFTLNRDGFHTWTEVEISQFEERHAIGTKARLALGLLLFLGQRRSDVVTLGRQHITGSSIAVRQQKQTRAWRCQYTRAWPKLSRSRLATT